MRTFVLIGHTATLDPGFSLDDLPGDGGRLDVLCRNVTASLLLSHGIRQDVRVVVVMQDELTIEFHGEEIRHLRPDERSTAALFRRALETADDRVVSRRAVESTPGIHVRRMGLAGALDLVADRGEFVRLHSHGPLLEADDIPPAPIFVLSDHQPLTGEEVAIVDAQPMSTYSLGPNELHGDHAIAIAHNLCDRASM